MTLCPQWIAMHGGACRTCRSFFLSAASDEKHRTRVITQYFPRPAAVFFSMLRTIVQRALGTVKSAVPSQASLIGFRALRPLTPQFSTMMTKNTLSCSSLQINSTSILSAGVRPTFKRASSPLFINGVRTISTMRRRRTKMNKHKLRKRRKARRMNTKISRVV